MKKNIRLLSPDKLKSELSELGMPSYTHKQVIEWLWKKNVRAFSEMTNISKHFREVLSETFFIDGINKDLKQKSVDGTIKFRFELHDGHKIETVLIPVASENRFTVCVSSQVGCSLSCSFCATGLMKLMRNLTAGEIVDQYSIVNQVCLREYGQPISNIVYMGMGEPLLNYRQVVDSVRYLTDEKYLNLSARRITISTAGIAKMIEKLADENIKCNLALSLHSADDIKRNKIMAINESNNLESLMEALKVFFLKTRNKITYEYIAFQGFNDTLQDASKLADLCWRGFTVQVNIIEYNPVPGLDFVKSQANQLDRFAKNLRDRDVMVTIRRSRGKDIDAACGQLANREA